MSSSIASFLTVNKLANSYNSKCFFDYHYRVHLVFIDRFKNKEMGTICTLPVDLWPQGFLVVLLLLEAHWDPEFTRKKSFGIILEVA